jgi:hypothetical protein
MINPLILAFSRREKEFKGTNWAVPSPARPGFSG